MSTPEVVPREQPAGGIVVAVAAVVTRGDRVLLIERGHAPARGRWSLPGGRLLVGESLADGVARELEEETALRATAVGPLLEIVEVVRPAVHYLILGYRVDVATDDEAVAGSDAAAVAWVTDGELESLDTTDRLREFLDSHSAFGRR